MEGHKIILGGKKYVSFEGQNVKGDNFNVMAGIINVSMVQLKSIVDF